MRGRLKVDAELERAPTVGDRVLLERMVANLVDNAVRHNSTDGWVGIRTARENGGAVVEIANTGPALSAEQIPTLFEPFARAAQRLDPTAGVGLGLSIASAIAHAHAATITAQPRASGGLELTIPLPTG